MNDKSIIIRALEPQDMAGVTDVFNQPRAVWGTMQSPLTSLAERQKWNDSRPDGDTRIVATIAGRVIGLAGMQGNANRRRAHAASLGMAVHDDFAGRGVGRALIVALIDKADRWCNYHRLELTVWADNARAIGLYESVGFFHEGRHRDCGWRDGAYVDALAMARLYPAAELEGLS